jgi:transcriptional regulator with XRE-family HTH domain
VIFINLKELRINAGLTQEAAAKMLDLEQSAISHWEQGLKNYDSTKRLRKKKLPKG